MGAHTNIGCAHPRGATPEGTGQSCPCQTAHKFARERAKEGYLLVLHYNRHHLPLLGVLQNGDDLGESGTLQGQYATRSCFRQLRAVIAATQPRAQNRTERGATTGREGKQASKYATSAGA